MLMMSNVLLWKLLYFNGYTNDILMCDNEDVIIIIVPSYVFNKEPTGITHFGTHTIGKVPFKGKC